MFQRKQTYSGVETSGEEQILRVLRFHEVRLGKIEKHLINANKHIQVLINERNKSNSSKKTSPELPKNQGNSFNLLKDMMTNLTEQVVVSQNFMKEIKDVIGKLNSTTINKPVKDVVKKPNFSEEFYTNQKMAELERDIAKASIISIGMNPTVERIDEYVERNRRDRKRFLNDAHKQPEIAVDNTTNTTEDEDEEEEEEEEVAKEEISQSVLIDDAVLENNVMVMTNFKTTVEEEVQEVIDKIPVIIKPRKKRRGRPKKKINA